MPHERDESAVDADSKPRDVMRQAAQDLDRGLVDTDMRATPGLDGPRRDALVGDVKPRSAKPKARRETGDKSPG